MRTILFFLLVMVGLFLGCSDSPTEHQSTSYIADVQYEFQDWQPGAGWENLGVTVVITLYSGEEIDVVAQCPSSVQPVSEIKLTAGGYTHNGNIYTFAFHGSCSGWTSGISYSLQVYLDGICQYSGSMIAPNP